MPSCRWICCSCCRLFSGSLSTKRNQKEPHPCCFHACSMIFHTCGAVGAVFALSRPVSCSERRKLGGWSIQSCRGPPLCVEQLLREILEMTRKQIETKEKKQTEESNFKERKQMTTVMKLALVTWFCLGDNQADSSETCTKRWLLESRPGLAGLSLIGPNVASPLQLLPLGFEWS